MGSSLLVTYKNGLQKILDTGLIPRFRFLRTLNRFIVSRLTPDRVEILGHTMYLDPVDSLHITKNNGVYEPLETGVVQANVKEGDVVVDAGANIGYYTLLLARLVGPKGKVFAIEPDPENFALLKKNVEANGYNNVTLIQKAVGGESGTVKLFRSIRNGAQHSLALSDSDAPFVEVDLARIDDLVTEPINFMKIDVEGAELGAMNGARALFAKSPNVKIMTEFNPRALDDFGVPTEKYLALLQDYGFRFSDIDKKRGTVHPTTVEEVTAACNLQNGQYTNLLCERK